MWDRPLFRRTSRTWPHPLPYKSLTCRRTRWQTPYWPSWTALRTVLTDPAEWLAEYRRRCVNLGRPVRVLRGNTVRQATALAIDEQFGLTVQYENGETETVRSGEVSVRGLYGYIE